MMLTIDAHVEASGCTSLPLLLHPLPASCLLTPFLRAWKIPGKYADPPHDIFTHAPTPTEGLRLIRSSTSYANVFLLLLRDREIFS
jgi:hypothetical protein